MDKIFLWIFSDLGAVYFSNQNVLIKPQVSEEILECYRGFQKSKHKVTAMALKVRAHDSSQSPWL